MSTSKKYNKEIFQKDKFDDYNIFLETLFNTIANPIFYKGDDGKYILCNTAFLNFVGKGLEEVIGADVFDLFSSEDAHKFHEMDIRILKDKKTQIFEHRIQGIKNSNIKEFILTKSLAKIPGKNSFGIIGVITDISERKKIEDELRKTKDYLEIIIQGANAIILGYDLNGNIQMFNKKAEQTFNISDKEVIGKNWRDTLKFYKTNKTDNFIEQFVKSKKISHKRTISTHKTDAKNITIEWQNFEIFQNGSVTGFLSLGYDISENKQKDDEIRKLSVAVEQNPSSILITDNKGIIEYYNPAFSKVTGYNKNELIGKNVSILKSGTMPDNYYNTLWKTISSGDHWSGEFCNKRKDGSLYWQRVNISPIINETGNITNYISINLDVTDFKKSFNKIYQEKLIAEDSEKVKNTILSNLSQELRMPLIGILGYSEILQNEITDNWHLEMIKDINAQGKRLLNTVSLVLRLAQIESGSITVNLQKTNITDVVMNIHQFFINRAEAKNINFSVVPGNRNLYVKADVAMLKEILNNLTDNAIKFTEKGDVTISIQKKIIDSKPFVTISFKDTGSGIDRNQIKNIFKDLKKYNIESLSNYENSGLGLSVSQFMANIMGGNIEVTSVLGAGSEFTFNIPEYISEEYSIDNSKVKLDKLYEKEKDQLNILLVEDNEANINIVEIFLKGIFKVKSVRTGEEALKIVSEKNYDAIIMDINLGGGINGIATAQSIRKISNYEKIPILAVTGYALAGDKDVLLKKGFNGYLAKPYTKNQLINLINEFL